VGEHYTTIFNGHIPYIVGSGAIASICDADDEPVALLSMECAYLHPTVPPSDVGLYPTALGATAGGLTFIALDTGVEVAHPFTLRAHSLISATIASTCAVSSAVSTLSM